MVSAVTTLGNIMGPLFTGPTGLRGNLYTIALSDTGSGKDSARRMGAYLLDRCGMVASVGSDVWTNEYIMEREISTNQHIIWYIDEMGSVLREWGMKKVSGHKLAIRDLLLKASSGDRYVGRPRNNGPGTIIDTPHASVFATAQPQLFWKHVNRDMILSGFISRFLVYEGKPYTQPVYRPDLKRREDCFPPELAQHVLSLMSWGGRMAKRPESGAATYRIPLAPDARVMDETLFAECYRQYELAKATSPTTAVMWTRARERVLRLALIYACAESSNNPQITKAGLSWAWRMMRISSAYLVGLDKYIPQESLRNSQLKLMVTYIKKAKAKGRTAAELRIKIVEKSVVTNDLIHRLVDSGLVTKTIRTNRLRPLYHAGDYRANLAGAVGGGWPIGVVPPVPASLPDVGQECEYPDQPHHEPHTSAPSALQPLPL